MAGCVPLPSVPQSLSGAPLRHLERPRALPLKPSSSGRSDNLALRASAPRLWGGILSPSLNSRRYLLPLAAQPVPTLSSLVERPPAR